MHKTKIQLCKTFKSVLLKQTSFDVNFRVPLTFLSKVEVSTSPFLRDWDQRKKGKRTFAFIIIIIVSKRNQWTNVVGSFEALNCFLNQKINILRVISVNKNFPTVFYRG